MILNKKFSTYDLDDIKRYIEENMHVEKFGGGSGKSKRFHFQVVSSYVHPDEKEGERPTYETIAGNGRPYQFMAKDFMSLQEYYDLFPDEKPEKQDTQQEIDGLES